MSTSTNMQTIVISSSAPVAIPQDEGTVQDQRITFALKPDGTVLTEAELAHRYTTLAEAATCLAPNATGEIDTRTPTKENMNKLFTAILTPEFTKESGETRAAALAEAPKPAIAIAVEGVKSIANDAGGKGLGCLAASLSCLACCPATTASSLVLVPVAVVATGVAAGIAKFKEFENKMRPRVLDLADQFVQVTKMNFQNFQVLR